MQEQEITIDLDLAETLTGKALRDVPAELRKVLPPGAYTEVRGTGADLTDINNAFLLNRLNDIFGPFGVGWWYDYRSEDVYINEVQGKTWWEIAIPRFEFYYRFRQDGKTYISDPLIAGAGSDNKRLMDAMKGAVTSGIGSALSKMEWQIYVYMGIVTHRNAGQYYGQEEPDIGQAEIEVPGGATGRSETSSAGGEDPGSGGSGGSGGGGGGSSNSRTFAEILEAVRDMGEQLEMKGARALSKNERGKLIRAIENSLDPKHENDEAYRRQQRHAIYMALWKTTTPHDAAGYERAMFGWVKPHKGEINGEDAWLASKKSEQELRKVYREFMVKAPEEQVLQAFEEGIPEAALEAREELASEG